MKQQFWEGRKDPWHPYSGVGEMKMGSIHRTGDFCTREYLQ